MRLSRSAIPDVLVIDLAVFADERGFFLESYQDRKYAAAGIVGPFVQDNHSRSGRGVLRGLHYQIGCPQGKLITVVAGTVFDVAVDLRRSSPTFGRWVGLQMSAAEHRQVWVPPGFAHGFYALSEWAEVMYKVTDYYSPQAERTLFWADPDVGVAWPLLDGEQPIVSAKDAHGLRLGEAPTYD
jgi:dTDP-4-dehydrorhamnose 3,5-epimerase